MPISVCLAQLNPVVGDIDANAARIAQAIAHAHQAGAALAIFPEQALLGYPAKDLLLRPELLARQQQRLVELAASCRGVAAIVGFAEPRPPGDPGRGVFNSAVLLMDGRVHTIWRKRLLPTYDVFDEARYFEPAAEPQPVVEFAGRRLGVVICEDVLFESPDDRPLYTANPAADLANAGANLIVCISASPYWLNKQNWRLQRLQQTAQQTRAAVVCVNQVGGNDSLIFDGASTVHAESGELLSQLPSFDDALQTVTLDSAGPLHPSPCDEAAMTAALTLGLRDYVRKCGFQKVLLGLSGGIDSAVTAALAVRALGPERVIGVALPSRFSSTHSLADARELARNLSIQLIEAPIEPLHAAAEAALAHPIKLVEAGAAGSDVTFENVQARARGLMLMALSNYSGAMLLTTGNKSELAVGYCTLYGDMCGGLAVISDVPKTWVYRLAQHLNAQSPCPLIPLSSIRKPPSAELRPDQTDQDTLPPYDVLDEILRLYELESATADEIVASGFEASVVQRVLRLLHQSEYKRQQAPPGLKVTTRAFGFGRRMPIAARVQI